MSKNSKPILKKVARVENRANKSILEQIEFQRHSKSNGCIELLPSVVNDRKLLERHLRDAGAVLPNDPGELRILLDGVAKSSCEKEVAYAAQPGWLPNRKGFVTAKGVLGNTRTKVVGFRRSRPNDPRGLATLCGDVETWKKTIGTAAASSSVAMFAISAALAAPLLKVVNKPSFGFCLFGPTRTGKTFATAAAGSVVGLGTTQNMLDWNLTDARLQQQLPEFNDSLTPIDDLKSMGRGNKSKHKRIAWLSYVLSVGSGVARHTAFEETGAVSWRTIVLTSNETSLQQLANSGRSERSGGETARLIDVPAIFDGSLNICDRRTSIDFEKAFPRLERNQGHIFQSFVEEMMPRVKGFRPRIIGYVKEFTSHVRDAMDGLLARDVANKFGLVYAAGRLGISYGLLPWKIADLRHAVAKCYFGARDLLPDTGVLVRFGVKLLEQYLTKLPQWSSVLASPSGFREDAHDGSRHLIKRDRFNEIFRSAEQRDLVIQWLISKRRIKLAKTDSEMPLIKEQHFWPDGKRHRSVQVFWPKAKPSTRK